MTRTGLQIVDDVIALLAGSSLAGSLSGSIYHEGERPRDSRLEDAVVVFTAASASQIQSGVVTVNIFIADFDARGNGVSVMNGRRCKEVEQLAQQWFDSLSTGMSDYRWRLTQAISTDSDTAAKQHFVVIRLGFDFFTNN